MPDASPQISLASLDEIVDLRHAILRAGLPRETAIFTGDELETSRHWAARIDGQVIGCVTLHRKPYGDEQAWQLRGMAVKSGLQRGGIGALLLTAAEDYVVTADTRPVLWCNAREPAAGFYQRFGWKIDSDRFIIPDAGPHFRMVKQLG